MVTKYTKEHYIKIITSIDADKEECNNRIFYEKTEVLAGYMDTTQAVYQYNKDTGQYEEIK